MSLPCALAPRVLLLSRLSTAAVLRRRVKGKDFSAPRHNPAQHRTGTTGVVTLTFLRAFPTRQQQQEPREERRFGRNPFSDGSTTLGYVVVAAASGSIPGSESDSGGGGGDDDGDMATSGGSGVPNDFGNFNKVASSVAAERNKAPIAEVIVPYLTDAPEGGVLVEMACGTGQHAAHIAPLLPRLTIQPTDLDDSSFDAVAHHCSAHANVKSPIVVDASTDWASELCSRLGADGAPGASTAVSAVLVVNMTHISPYAATQGLMRGAGAVLRPGGHLFIYGPFKRNGRHTSEGNETFDASLRGRNPEWGYRDLEAVADLAAAEGMITAEVRDMPANNFMLVFKKN